MGKAVLKTKLWQTLQVAAIALMIIAYVGQLVRDRWMVTALAMYIPPIFATLFAALVFLKSKLKRQWIKSVAVALAIVPTAIWLSHMIGPGDGLGIEIDPANQVRIIQWNTRFGGGNFQPMLEKIVSLKPDLVLLSEAPGYHDMESLKARLGSNWNYAKYDRPYVRMIVLAPAPVEVEQERQLHNGDAFIVSTKLDGNSIRVMMVDGASNPLIDRQPFLTDVKNLISAADHSPQQIDLIAGDFNTVGQSRGLDDFPGFGSYRLATSAASFHWIGTYPSWCPVYDIDHLWISMYPQLLLDDCKMFSAPGADHRGELILFSRPVS